MKTNILHLLLFGFSLIFLNCWTLELYEPPCPVVTSLNPAGAPFDSIVTVTGQNFLAMCPELHIVKIGDTQIPAENILEVPTANTLKFKVPKGIGSGPVAVTIKTGTGCSDVAGGAEFVYYYTATMVRTVNFSGTPTNLNAPAGIDVDAAGRVFVCDQNNNIIRIISTSGTATNIGNHLSPGCNGSFIADASIAQFKGPVSIIADANGDIYIGEKFNHVIRKAPATGGVNRLVGTCNTAGTDPGDCFTAQFNVPKSMAKNGNIIYVIDNNEIRLVDVSTSCAQVSSLALNGNPLLGPVAIDFSTSRTGAGPLYVVNFSDKKIKSVSTGGLVTDLPMNNPILNDPAAIDVDAKGAIFIVDRGRHQVLVLYPNGDLVPLAGVGLPGSTDGVPGNAARFISPSGLALFETAGILYVSDTGNNSIRKLTLE